MLLWPILFAILPFLHTLARWTAPASAFVTTAIDIGANATSNAGTTEVVELAGEFMDEVVTYPAGPLLWLGIGIALAVLRLGHMCYS